MSQTETSGIPCPHCTKPMLALGVCVPCKVQLISPLEREAMRLAGWTPLEPNAVWHLPDDFELPGAEL